MYISINNVYFSFMDTFIWFMFNFLTAKNRPYFQLNMDTHGRRSHIYLLQLCIWIVFLYFVYSHDHWYQSWVSSKIWLLLILLCSNPYISNMYILNQSPRLPYHTICVTYLDYISPLLVYSNFPLNFKTGGCWNLLESPPSRIPLIELSQKWTQIPFIILNDEYVIWICNQPTIDVNPQPNFYYVLTLYHTRSCHELHLLWIPSNKPTTYLEPILYLVPSGYEPFMQVFNIFSFFCDYG